ncbi:MAG: hypothetical protein LBJ18_01555 [Rickettsiales bacterium]|jgi:hypothetical protein|nr:hypothetical protein [Rickettsiales bacterium]
MNKSKTNHFATRDTNEALPAIIAMDINGVLLESANSYILGEAMATDPIVAIGNLMFYKIYGIGQHNKIYMNDLLRKVALKIPFLPNAQIALQKLNTAPNTSLHICSNMGNYDLMYKRLNSFGIPRENFHINDIDQPKAPIFSYLKFNAAANQELIVVDDQPENIISALHAGFDCGCLITTNKKKIKNIEQKVSKELGGQTPEYLKTFPSAYEFAQWYMHRAH